MKDILQNEINRQEYMELRYRILDEEQNKNDSENVLESRGDDATSADSEVKYVEDGFNVEKLKILEELGLRKTDEEFIN
jgi:hypothetical protein